MSGTSGAYVAIFLLLFIVIMEQRKRKNAAAIRKIISNRRKGNKAMNIILNGFENKDVTVYTLNDQVQGRIVEIGEGWIKIDSGKEVSTVNLDYVIRVRERFKKSK